MREGNLKGLILRERKNNSGLPIDFMTARCYDEDIKEKEENRMKKLIAVALSALMVVSVAGCSSAGKPEDVVTQYCDALISYDGEAASSCFVSGSQASVVAEDEGLVENKSDLMKQVEDYLAERVKETEYTVGESTIEGDAAVVPVTFTYVDATPVFSAAIGDYMSQAIALMFSGADDAVTEDLFGSIFVDKAKSVSVASDTVTIEFKCVKQEKEWRLESLDEDDQRKVESILSCNILEAVDSMGDGLTAAFADEFEETEQEDELVDDEYDWYDIPAGQTLELATVKMTLTGYEETDQLVAKYLDPDVAQEGTKFIVIAAEIENVTKSPIDFNNTLSLFDDQGREFPPYPDALWYFDEAFSYTELMPNIKVGGAMVYHVPSDAQNCYLVVGKSGTNEAYRLYLE